MGDAPFPVFSPRPASPRPLAAPPPAEVWGPRNFLERPGRSGGEVEKINKLNEMHAMRGGRHSWVPLGVPLRVSLRGGRGRNVLVLGLNDGELHAEARVITDAAGGEVLEHEGEVQAPATLGNPAEDVLGLRDLAALQHLREVAGEHGDAVAGA